MPTFLVPITLADSQALMKFPVVGMGGREIEVFLSALATVAPMFSSDYTKDLVVVTCPPEMAPLVSKAFEGFEYKHRVVPTEEDTFLAAEEVVLAEEAPQDTFVVIRPRQMILASPTTIKTLRHLRGVSTVPCVEICHNDCGVAPFHQHHHDNVGVYAFRNAKQAFIAAKRVAPGVEVSMGAVVFYHDGFPKSLPVYVENLIPLATVKDVEDFSVTQVQVLATMPEATTSPVPEVTLGT